MFCMDELIQDCNLTFLTPQLAASFSLGIKMSTLFPWIALPIISCRGVAITLYINFRVQVE